MTGRSRMERRTAVVVGGGIGGLAAARGLVRAGWGVQVFEQAPEFRPLGAGITLAPNAVRALDALGLGGALRNRAMAQGAAGVRTSSGRWIMRGRLDALEAMFGVPAFALHRADLHQLLIDSVRDADLRTGHRVLGVAQRPDGRAAVTYEQPDSGSTTTAEVAVDLVVAADGLHSTVRRVLFPGHPGPAYAGYMAWRGVVPAERAGELGQESVTETWGRGRRFGIVPLADRRVYWFATASFPAGTHTDDELADLETRFRDWHRPIPELLAATPSDALLRHDIYYLRQPLPSYVADRVVLLGDAAHAITPDLGQGACLALEDAATVANLTGDGDVDAAVRRYDHARRIRTQRLVRESARVGRVAQWSNPVAVALRDTVVSLVSTQRYLRSSADTYAWTPPLGT